MDVKKLEEKRARCMFFRRESLEGMKDWCAGKDEYCNGWCTA